MTEIAAPAVHDERWSALGSLLPARLDGARALVLGAHADGDAADLARRGAGQVIAGIRLPWQELDPAHHGAFDLIVCDGLLHRETHPMALLQALRSVLAPGGTLVLGCAVLSAVEGSESIRVVPTSFLGDAGWWMVPGRLALRWMVEAAGFRPVDEVLAPTELRGEFPVSLSYISASEGAPSPHLGLVRG
jgi:SAM-dependent methyltransferase